MAVFGDAGCEKLSKEQAAILKKILANEEITAEIKGGKILSFKPNVRTLIHTNSKWTSSDTSSGYERRFLYLETQKTVAKVTL